jgi:hypothetical protein
MTFLTGCSEKTEPGKASPGEVLKGEKRTRMAGNMLAYLVIGDPALKPFDGIEGEPK